MTVEERFWEKVDRSGDCWEWTGAVQSAGYGVVNHRADGGVKLAHRVSFAWAHGDPGRRAVEHSCENRRCVNPAHLAIKPRGYCQRCGMADRNARGDCAECDRRLKRDWNLANPGAARARLRALRISEPWRFSVYNARGRAKKFGVAYALSDAFVRALVAAGKCSYCDVEVSYNTGNGRTSETSPTLDRLNPDLGYTEGNVVLACYRCNRRKGNLTPSTLRALADRIETLTGERSGN